MKRGQVRGLAAGLIPAANLCSSFLHQLTALTFSHRPPVLFLPITQSHRETDPSILRVRTLRLSVQVICFWSKKCSRLGAPPAWTLNLPGLRRGLRKPLCTLLVPRHPRPPPVLSEPCSQLSQKPLLSTPSGQAQPTLPESCYLHFHPPFETAHGCSGSLSACSNQALASRGSASWTRVPLV